MLTRTCGVVAALSIFKVAGLAVLHELVHYGHGNSRFAVQHRAL
jgi:hypothetical protein